MTKANPNTTGLTHRLPVAGAEVEADVGGVRPVALHVPARDAVHAVLLCAVGGFVLFRGVRLARSTPTPTQIHIHTHTRRVVVLVHWDAVEGGGQLGVMPVLAIHHLWFCGGVGFDWEDGSVN